DPHGPIAVVVGDETPSHEVDRLYQPRVPRRRICTRWRRHEQYGRDERERGAEAERRRRPVRIPHEAEDEAGRERADACHGVVNAEGETAALSGGEIRNERLLGALGEAE